MVTFDPAQTSYAVLAGVFWSSHTPLVDNGDICQVNINSMPGKQTSYRGGGARWLKAAFGGWLVVLLLHSHHHLLAPISRICHCGCGGGRVATPS
jgi:hypothetical protein